MAALTAGLPSRTQTVLAAGATSGATNNRRVRIPAILPCDVTDPILPTDPSLRLSPYADPSLLLCKSETQLKVTENDSLTLNRR